MLVQMSDPLLAPLLGSWRLDPLSMQVVLKILPVHVLQNMDMAMRHARSVGNEELFRKFLTRCKDDKVVIGARQLTFHHHGKHPFSLPIQKVSKEGRRTLLHCIQRPPYPVGPVTYSFHFYEDRLVMREQNGLRKTITHKFFVDK